MKTENQDKKFWLKLIMISTPIAIQYLIESSINLMNMAFIGRLGETYIAAAGIVNQIVFILIVLLFGINSGASMFISQFWGAKDESNVKKMLGLSIILGAIVAFVFSINSILFPEFIISIFTRDSVVIKYGAQYLKYSAIGFIPMAVSLSYIHALRCIGKVNLSTIVSAICLVISMTLTYLLVFGQLGFPKLYLAGAGLASTVARLIEMVALISIVVLSKNILSINLRQMFSFDMNFVKTYFKRALSVIASELLWVGGLTIFTIIYARMGTDILAATNITSTIEQIGMVLFIGFSQAALIFVGNEIGAGNLQNAKNCAGKILKFSLICSLILAIAIYLLRNIAVNLFDVSERVAHISETILIFISIVLPIKGFNIINLVGILRSGGDSKYVLILDIGILWAIAIPLGLAGAFIWKLSITNVFLLICSEEVLKFILGYIRYRSGKWIHRLSHEFLPER